MTRPGLARLNVTWKSNSISLHVKIKVHRFLVVSIFLYRGESWTLTADTERQSRRLSTSVSRGSYVFHTKSTRPMTSPGSKLSLTQASKSPYLQQSGAASLPGLATFSITTPCPRPSSKKSLKLQMDSGLHFGHPDLRHGPGPAPFRKGVHTETSESAACAARPLEVAETTMRARKVAASWKSPPETRREQTSPWKQEESSSPWRQEETSSPWRQEETSSPWRQEETLSPWRQVQVLVPAVEQVQVLVPAVEPALVWVPAVEPALVWVPAVEPALVWVPAVEPALVWEPAVEPALVWEPAEELGMVELGVVEVQETKLGVSAEVQEQVLAEVQLEVA
ncbi:uncharacterized protein [Nerophis lumbriciformis]|uniref:uncharacterized protein n=1 Tax=Nerophis lumbriciformis TaxID=546530 RepID=UPI003BA93DAC